MAGLRHRRGDPWSFARPSMAIGATNLGEGEDDLGQSPWSIHRIALTNRGEDEDDLWPSPWSIIAIPVTNRGEDHEGPTSPP
jgi:hypothetical protein